MARPTRSKRTGGIISSEQWRGDHNPMALDMGHGGSRLFGCETFYKALSVVNFELVNST